MTLTDYINRLLGRSRQFEVNIYCPLSEDSTTETRIATEETEPDEWVQDNNVAIYECSVCGSRHRFLWGPPTPLYLGDVPGRRDDAATATGDYKKWRAT